MKVKRDGLCDGSILTSILRPELLCEGDHFFLVSIKDATKDQSVLCTAHRVYLVFH